MHVVVVFFEVRQARVESFRQAILENARLSREKEIGCRQFDVAVDPTDGASFFLYEVYDTEAAFREHLESAHFAAFNDLVTPWVKHKRVLSYELLPPHGLS